MKKLSRFEMATIKRTALNVKSMRNKKAKLENKIDELSKELEVLNNAIDRFEEPIKEMTGGFTSEEVLSGAMNVSEATEASPEGEVDDVNVTTVEVPAEEAVAINPDVVSPLAEY